MKIKSLLYSFVAMSGALLLGGCSDDDAVMPANPDKPVAVTDATSEIIYEVNPRLYGTSECFKGITAALNDIQATGTTVLWIMPINTPGELNAVGSPYCVRDYKGINPAYGTAADFQALVNQAHSMGMTVILDWIANHTSWDNAWITEHPEWYVRDAEGNVQPTESWADVAQLDWTNTDMQAAMIEAMVYWVDTYGIDGFRCDYADGVPNEFWATANATLKSHNVKLMLAESSDTSKLDAGFDMIYGWNFGSSLQKLFSGKLTPTKFFEESAKEIAGVTTGKQVMRFAINHDTASESSANSLYGGAEGMEAAQVIAMMLDGTPMVYDALRLDYTGTINFFNYSTGSFNADKTARLGALAQAFAATQEQRCGQLATYQAGKAVVFSRSVGDKTVLVMVNPTGSELTVKTPISMAGVSMTDALNNAPATLPATVTLGAYGYAIYYK